MNRRSFIAHSSHRLIDRDLHSHINHIFVYYVITKDRLQEIDDPQNPPFYPRSHPPAPRRPVRHGGRRHAPPHAGVPRPVPESAGPAESVCGNQERCAAALLFRNRRDGSFGLQSHLARGPGPGADRRQVRRALARSGQGLRLRSGAGDRALRADVRSRRDPQGPHSRNQGGLHAGHRDLDRRAPRCGSHRQADQGSRPGSPAGGRRHHRPGHHPLRRGRLGHRHPHRRLAEGGHDSARPRLPERERKGLGSDGGVQESRATTSTCARNARTR